MAHFQQQRFGAAPNRGGGVLGAQNIPLQTPYNPQGSYGLPPANTGAFGAAAPAAGSAHIRDPRHQREQKEREQQENERQALEQLSEEQKEEINEAVSYCGLIRQAFRI